MTSSFLEVGLDAFRRGRLPEAERQLRSLLRTEPRHPQALHLLGLIAHRRGEKRAIELLEAACAIEPENGEMRTHLAEVQPALDGDHDYVEAAHGLAQSLEKLDRGPDAIEAVRKIARRKPADPQAQANYGSMAHGQRDPEHDGARGDQNTGLQSGEPTATPCLRQQVPGR
jgi:Flp pilus assembly protein TadD